ncbi:MAG: 3-hydroxyacyl-ACP dehydratase [Saprospiraceae bacterium]|nr:3-hydroxyacyl-ACP dehydratase [Saprospiraceae bacterium]
MSLPLLLPQRAPIVMVDALTEHSALGASTQLLVREDNIFVQQGHLAEPGIIENIAQTAAAHAGYLALQHGYTEAPVGYIAAIDHLQVFELPPVGALLETRVDIQNQVLQVTIIRGSSSVEGRPVAQCEMKIFTRS